MRFVYFGVLAAALAGCATVSQMAATSGSRSDGIVKLSYEHGMFDKVRIDERTAQATAVRRCGTWGYTSAEPFGGEVRQCQAASGYGCTRWFVTREYQCTNGGNAAPPLASAASAPVTPMANDIRKVRANTESGYCLDVPENYVGTGSLSRPAITKALPRCSSLSAK